MVKLNVDGSVDVITALMDHGGGTLEAVAKLVGEALCVPFDKVNVADAGTTTTVYDCVTHATRGVDAGGGRARKAAAACARTSKRPFLNMYPTRSTQTRSSSARASSTRRRSPTEDESQDRGAAGRVVENDRRGRELPADELPRVRGRVPRGRVDTWTGGVRT
jgi:CO/xanthine dehydrogenase Mo-binding subunit